MIRKTRPSEYVVIPNAEDFVWAQDSISIEPKQTFDGRWILSAGVRNILDYPMRDTLFSLMGGLWVGTPILHDSSYWISPAGVYLSGSLTAEQLADFLAAQTIRKVVIKTFENTVMLNCCDFYDHTGIHV